jgi:hypothetical protein
MEVVEMSNSEYVPSEAEILASIVSGHGSHSYLGGAVQRSHRFPLHLFTQIENMARVAGVPVSAIINQLIECGLEAVKPKLPENILKQLTISSTKQIKRPIKTVHVEMKAKNLATPKKPKAKKS